MKATVALCLVVLTITGLHNQVSCGGIPNDPACGQTKGCTPDCSAGDCKYLITWADDGDSVQFELKTDVSEFKKGDNWTAVGFSYDDMMNSTSVVACVEDKGKIFVENSYNVNHTNHVLTDSKAGLTLQSSSMDDGILFCRFTRAKMVPGEMEIYDLNKEWILLKASGPAKGGVKHKHTVRPVATATMVDLKSTDIVPAEKPPVDDTLFFEPEY